MNTNNTISDNKLYKEEMLKNLKNLELDKRL